MKRLFFMFAFVMIMALSLFTLISNVKDVEAYFWETEATMTLTESGEEVMPDIVYDGSDGNRKLKIYTIKGDKNYILQTSSNNDYACYLKHILLSMLIQKQNMQDILN